MQSPPQLHKCVPKDQCQQLDRARWISGAPVYLLLHEQFDAKMIHIVQEVRW